MTTRTLFPGVTDFFFKPKRKSQMQKSDGSLCVWSCVLLWTLTPAEAQKTLADESWPHFANDGQVGLPRLCQHPAEGRQEEEMQEGSGHSAEALQREENAEMERDKTTGDDLQGGSFVRCHNESSLRKMLQRIMKPLQNTEDKRAKRDSDEAHGV